MKNFRNVNLPRILIDEVEKFIKKPEVTHHTIASYTEYAIRKQLEKDKQEILDQNLLLKHKDYLETLEPKK